MLGTRIKELRKKNNVTQKQLADLLQVSQQTVGSWEVNRAEPNTDILKQLSRTFDVSIDYLLGNESESNQREIKYSKRLRNLAAHATDDITDEEMNEILSFIDFIKHRDRKNN